MSRSRETPVNIGGGIGGQGAFVAAFGCGPSGPHNFAFDSYFRGIWRRRIFLWETALCTGSEGTGTSADCHLACRHRGNRLPDGGKRLVRAFAARSAATPARSRRHLSQPKNAPIGRPTIEALREAGLAHVLAISGLNMVLAAGTFLIGARTLLSLVPGLRTGLRSRNSPLAGR